MENTRTQKNNSTKKFYGTLAARPLPTPPRLVQISTPTGVLYWGVFFLPRVRLLKSSEHAQ